MTLVICTLVMIGIKCSCLCLKGVCNSEWGVVAQWGQVALGMEVCRGIIMRFTWAKFTQRMWFCYQFGSGLAKQTINYIISSSFRSLRWYHRAWPASSLLSMLSMLFLLRVSTPSSPGFANILMLQFMLPRGLSSNRFFAYLLLLTLEFSSTQYLLLRCGHTFSLNNSPPAIIPQQSIKNKVHHTLIRKLYSCINVDIILILLKPRSNSVMQPNLRMYPNL